MGLKDLVLPTEKVEVPGGGEFVVRGLSLIDARVLVRKYSAEMSDLFSLIADGKKAGAIDIENAAATAAQLIDISPSLVADAIATAGGDGSAEDFAKVLMLPIPVQVDALTKIGRLTFSSEGSVKKFLQTVISLMGSLRDEPKL
jgi:hypothetical protein